MKKKNKFIFLATLSTACLLSLVSCQGAQGQKGDKGDPGINGTNGTDGKDGENGKSVLNGEGIPASSLGSNGDSYIDTKTFDFYVKESGSWVKKGSLKGTSEATKGEDGTSVRTGKGVPADTLGKDGDSYIDLSSFDFYVKSNGTWSKEGNIKGDKGSNGSNGSNGADGKTAWSNTILPSNGGYVTVNIGSALVDETVEFSFVADASHYLASYSFDGWETTEVPNVVQSDKGQTVKVSKQMISGGFIVAATFSTDEPSKPIQNNSDVSGESQTVSGNVAIVNTNTTSDVTLSASGDTKITSGEMKGSTTDEKTPVLDIKVSTGSETKTVTIASGVTISNYDLKLEDNVTLVIEEGANVTFNDVTLAGTATIKGSYKKANTKSVNSVLAASDEDTMNYDIIGDVVIEKGATLENVAIKGIITVKGTTGDFVMKDCYYQASGARTANAYLLINTTGKVSITGCEFHLNNGETDKSKKVYNFIEFGYSVVVNKEITISDNEFDCTNMTHNVINMYKFDTSSDSTIDLKNNTYKNVDFVGTQPVRISNSNKSDKKVSIDISNSSITSKTSSGDKAWDTFVLFQADNTDESYANVILTAKNMSIGDIGTNLLKADDKTAYYENLLVVYYKNGSNSFTIPGVTLDSGSIETATVLFSGGRGTEADPYILKTESDWKAITTNNKAGEEVYFKLASNLDLSKVTDKISAFKGTIDLNGYSLTLRENGTLITSFYGKLKNGTILPASKETNCQSKVGTFTEDACGNAVFEDLVLGTSDKSYSYIDPYNDAVLTNFVWKETGDTDTPNVTFKNVKNYVNFKSSEVYILSYGSAFLGAYCSDIANIKVTFEGCEAGGDVSLFWASLFVGNNNRYNNNNITYEFKDCKLTGSLKGYSKVSKYLWGIDDSKFSGVEVSNSGKFDETTIPTFTTDKAVEGADSYLLSFYTYLTVNDASNNKLGTYLVRYSSALGADLSSLNSKLNTTDSAFEIKEGESNEITWDSANGIYIITVNKNDLTNFDAFKTYNLSKCTLSGLNYTVVAKKSSEIIGMTTPTSIKLKNN